MFRLICLGLGYVLGCVQTAYYVGRILGGVDIRNHGSGNAGTTNMVRTLGARAGLLTFVLDILKGVAAYLLCAAMFRGSGTFFTIPDGNGLIPGLYAGFGVVLGHNFPAQLKFKGGKGMACSLGVFLCINPIISWTSYAIGIALVALTRYISCASIAISAVFGTLILLTGYSLEEKALCLAFSCLVIFRHKDNIKRLINGSENKFTFRKQQQTTTDKELV